MIKAAFYQDILTEEIVSASDVRKRAQEFSVNGKRALMMLPKSQENWSIESLHRLGVYPVESTQPPEHDSEFQTINGMFVEYVDGRAIQRWEINERYKTVDEKRRVVLKKLARIADEKRNAGIVVDGIPVKTTPDGIARLAGARAGAKPSRQFVTGDDTVRVLSAEQIEALFQAVDDHVQGCYDRQAELIHRIGMSDEPENVELQTGWPGDE